MLIKQRNNYRATLYDHGVDACDRTSGETVSNMYGDVMTDQSAGELHAWTQRFVSVPRGPRQGGCL